MTANAAGCGAAASGAASPGTCFDHLSFPVRIHLVDEGDACRLEGGLDGDWGLA